MSLFFNMLSRLVIAFFQGASVFWFHGCRHHLQWVILEPPKIKSLTVSIVSPSISHEVILVFWMLSFKPTISLFSFTVIKSLFSSYLLSAIRVVLCAYLRLLIFLSAILIPACAPSSLAFRMMYSAAAAAKLLLSCLTLCYPIDCSPPGSSVPGILQARILEWAAISFSDVLCIEVK